VSTSIVYDGYLERYGDGTCLAQLADLPGCFSLGTSPEEAMQRITAAIPAYYAWLAGHDEYTPLVQGPFHVVAKEVQETTPERGVFFASDAVPVTAEDLDWYLVLLEWAFEDLLALARSMPVSTLELPGEDGRSGRDCLIGVSAHLSRGLVYLLDQPAPLVPGTIPLASVLGWLEGAVQASIARLRATDEAERARIVEHEGMRWSVRRVLRQAILDARIQLAALEVVRAS
jgi:predicted RNase H-like HicB family nuclease